MIAPRSTAMAIALTRTTRPAPVTRASIVVALENAVATPSSARYATQLATFVRKRPIHVRIADGLASHVVLMKAGRFDVVTVFKLFVISQDQLPHAKVVAVLARYAVKEPTNVTQS